MLTELLATPKLTLLSPAQIEAIHQSALAILRTTGVRVDSPAAVARLTAHGAQPHADHLHLPPELVEWALASAPPVVELFDRRGRLAFRLGQDRTRFGIGVTNLFYQDPLTDALTPFTRAHMQLMARLGQRLPRYDLVSTVGIVQDAPPGRSDLYGTLDLLANSEKPLVLLVSDESAFPDVLDLLETLHGSLADRPFVLPYFNPVTPLVINQGTVEKMEAAIGRGLPFIFSNYSLAGASTPITPAGTLALLLAELLAGLTLAQVTRPGTPVVLGILPAYFDMRTMQNFYDPQSMLLNLACAQLMAHYHLPHCGTSGSGSGWGPDLLGAGDYWMNHLAAVLGGAGLAPFVGDNLGSKAFSPVNVVYVHEVIDQVLRFAAGFNLDPDAFGLDEIAEAGPGGSFLGSETTVRTFRKAYYNSPIFPRHSLERWQDLGRPRADQTLRQYTADLLATLTPPPDQAELTAQGEAWIEAR